MRGLKGGTRDEVGDGEGGKEADALRLAQLRVAQHEEDDKSVPFVFIYFLHVHL